MLVPGTIKFLWCQAMPLSQVLYIPFQVSPEYTAGERIESKDWFGNPMDICFYTKGWNKGTFSGRDPNQKFESKRTIVGTVI